MLDLTFLKAIDTIPKKCTYVRSPKIAFVSLYGVPLGQLWCLEVTVPLVRDRIRPQSHLSLKLSLSIGPCLIISRRDQPTLVVRNSQSNDLHRLDCALADAARFMNPESRDRFCDLWYSDFAVYSNDVLGNNCNSPIK